MQAERAVLGAILLDNKALETAIHKLRPEDFRFDHHRILYRAMLVMFEQQQPIDLITLSEFLQKHELLEQAQGHAYMASLVDGVPRVSNVGHYAQIVAEKAMRVEFAGVLESFKNSAIEENPASVAELQNDLEKSLTNLRGRLSNGNGNGNGNGHFLYSLDEFLAAEWPEPEHLIEKLLPCNNNSIVIAMPHHLKSFLMTGLALAATRAGTNVLGRLEVKRPVRTILMQIEEYNGELKRQINRFLQCPHFAGCERKNLAIIPRTAFDPDWYPKLLRHAEQFKPDWIILDVLRRFFVGSGDINSPKDVPVFLEKLEVIRDRFGCHITLVHHENRKDADIFAAAMGSGYFQTWAKTWIRLKRKFEDKKSGSTSVEVEFDTALTSSPEPMRLVLDFGATESYLRLESLEDGASFRDVMEALAAQWTVKDVAEVKSVNRSNAQRLIYRWIDDGLVEKVRTGNKGRGGMAIYREISPIEGSTPDGPAVRYR
jgi:hypothetical protein